MTHTRPFLCGMVVMPLALLGVAVVIAGSVTTPHTFTAGTPAVAAQVNENFSAHETAINDNDAQIRANAVAIAGMVQPRVWAAMDSDGAGANVTDFTGMKELSSVDIDAPSDGFLVIHGQAYINNKTNVLQQYFLNATVDGANAGPGTWLSSFSAGPSGIGTATSFCLTFHVVVPITAGAHTVTQSAGPMADTATFFHNRERLTVTFFATGTLTPSPSPQ